MLALDTYSSLGALLHDALLLHKSETALIELDRHKETKTLRYLDVRRQVARVSVWLDAQGIAPGDRVAILMSNQSRWPIAACAVLSRGAILVPIDHKLSGTEQAALITHAQARALIVEYALHLRLPALPSLLTLVSEGPEGTLARFEDLPEADTTEPVFRDRSDPAAIVYSSGTGGTPKGCVLTHDAYLEQLAALMTLFPFRPGHRVFSILPSNHAIDFMVCFLGPFVCGATVVHQRTLRPEFILSTLKQCRITHMAVVPLLLRAIERAIDERLDQRPLWQREALSLLSRTNSIFTRDRPDIALSRKLLGGVHDALGGQLELLFCGGAFVERRLAQRFYELGIPVVIGYGLTECATVATVNDLRPFRADSVGRAVSGVEIHIDHPSSDGIGEVWIRGRTRMKEYWQEPELTAQTITEEGWLRTGDLGWLDGSSHLHLVGRSKNMIVTAGGKNVYPEDIELAFEGLTECDELAVFASSYLWPQRISLQNERLVAVVRTKNPSAARSEIATLNRKLPEHRRIAAMLVLGEPFPRTASMKIKRDALITSVREHKQPEELVRIEAGHDAHAELT